MCSMVYKCILMLIYIYIYTYIYIYVLDPLGGLTEAIAHSFFYLPSTYMFIYIHICMFLYSIYIPQNVYAKAR